METIIDNKQIAMENRLEAIKKQILDAEQEVYYTEDELRTAKDSLESFMLNFKSVSEEYKNKYGEGYLDKMYRYR